MKKKVHRFVRPRLAQGGCILPGPSVPPETFTSTSMSARTEAERPAWWCRVDKLVVFDGSDAQTTAS